MYAYINVITNYNRNNNSTQMLLLKFFFIYKLTTNVTVIHFPSEHQGTTTHTRSTLPNTLQQKDGSPLLCILPLLVFPSYSQ